MKSIFLAALVLTASVHAMSRAPAPIPSPSPIAAPEPTPSPAPSLKIVFKPIDFYTTPEQRTKIVRVGEKANALVQSKCFKDWISARHLIDTEGRTPAQVATHLQSVSGVVPVKVYYRCMRSWRCPTGTTAVAYREGDTIYLNSAVFSTSQPDSEWMGTQLHEGLGHLLGSYGHSFDWTPTRDYSVPYSLGGATSAHGGDVIAACLKAG